MDFVFVLVACCYIVWLLFLYFVVPVCMFVEGNMFAGYVGKCKKKLEIKLQFSKRCLYKSKVRP